MVKNPLDDLIMSTEEAAKIWRLSRDHVKRLCREGKCIAKKFGEKTYVILRDQPNPSKKNHNDGGDGSNGLDND